MAKWWLGVALTVGGMAVAAPAPAQYLPPGSAGAPGFAPPGTLPPGPAPAAAPAGAYAPVPPGGPGEPCPIDPESLGGPPIGGPNNAFPLPDCCPTCNYKECFHIDADYLLWYTRKHSLPALVTSGSPTDLPPGALGQRGTTTLLDGTGLDDSMHSGARVTMAVDLDPAQVWALEATGFVLEDKGASELFSGNGLPGSPILARPFFNALTGREGAAVFAAPGVFNGNLNVGVDTFFYGADANVRYNAWRSPAFDGRWDILVGARYLALDEGLSFDQNVTGLAFSPLPGSLTTSSESFKTTNRFYGGQVGAAYEGRVGDVILNAFGKFAVGETVQTLDNSGFTTVTGGGAVSTVPSGLLVQPSNTGRFTRQQTSFVPTIGMNLGYEFNRNLRLVVGYTLIVWTNVLRPEDQIDRNLTFGQVPGQTGTAPPGVNLQNTTFWAQGLNVGVQLSF